ncbi:hypothetical protein T8K17_00455 [Thalassobaculum sp. OXR-137]|uniref:hypothetical protein n=1 Tax=Thalassobaculum sp. OXR-137 TaxID=3100173 RepID=UPI002AC940D6|nr:hypothetical protein [Thalassobaculum sp. OXR-137]WPZ34618.1 hypothetical protein T8K17_00455 [Thalassobaculum sp. OXR-137]
MTKLFNLAKGLVIVLGLALVTAQAAQAQSLQPIVPEAAQASSFDAYRAVAITAGVVGGAVVATIVTDGLILPVYGTLTGSSIGALGQGNVMALLHTPTYAFFRGSMRLLGAVSGGLYADAWYTD